MRQETVRRLVSVALLLLLVLFFGTTSRDFLTSANILTFLREAAVVGIVAVGMTFVIITAGIDLSVGAVLAFVSMLCANLLYYSQAPVPVILLIAAAAGSLAGLLNGFFVTRLHLPDFIATLASMGIFRGLTLIIAIRTHGQITNKVIGNPDFLILGGHIGGLYLVTLVFFAVVVLGQVVLKRTRFGVYVYAVGAHRKSAELSGIPTGLVKAAVYGISGLCCAIGAVFLTARLQTAIPEMGMGLEFDVIAAVVIGGCAFNGGRGDIVGSLIGALFMTVLTNGIYKYNLPSAFQLILKGGVIVGVVVFDSVYRKMMDERLRKQTQAVPPDAQEPDLAKS